jgi:CRP/FNR family nitrogen fixation transcriptional regulator
MAIDQSGTGTAGSGQGSRLDALAVRLKFHRNQEICGQGQRAANWYRVVRGGVRRCMLRSDGKRQIVGLLLPGDFFGLTAGEEYDYSAESVAEETVVSVYPRRLAEALGDSDPTVAREIRALVLSVITQLQTQLLIMGRTTATEKVSSFLLDMSHRLPNNAPGRITLPVSRYDIADYLGISAETVSRSLSGLNQRGLISFKGTRQVRIVNPHALEDGYRAAA